MLIWDKMSSHKADSRNFKELELYGFNFSYKPVDFTCDLEDKKILETLESRRNNIENFSVLFRRIVAKVARPLLYPGSSYFLRWILSSSLLQGRIKLLSSHFGNIFRYKICTFDGNFIDCIFVDRRGTPNGNRLIVCCEGNASFYEHSCATCFVQEDFSLVGYNRPGYGCSSGLPSAASDTNALISILYFCTFHLNWSLADVFLYCWSIGAVSATGGAAFFQKELGGLILDAPFDDVILLAQARMPACLSNFTAKVIKENFDFDIPNRLLQFRGPIKIIRRLRDEVMSSQLNILSSNRTNFLIAKFISKLFPDFTSESAILEVLERPLPHPITEELPSPWKERLSEVKQILNQRDIAPPHRYIGRSWTDEGKTNFLVSIIHLFVKDVNMSHCQPLTSLHCIFDQLLRGY
ncbi:phosphatidylserine lipase ABHD16A-like [Zophobas morio]|uniref:phosphatidylserine lipase ABHD16A-like n=1 Tax=Zophobas morio TaxID=2755281 RepID=UPI0030834E94